MLRKSKLRCLMLPSLQRMVIVVLVLVTSFPAICGTAGAVWQPTPPREPKAGEIPVTAPGNCDQAGATYILMRDIAAAASALFLGKDVTLDLNGHTLTYAAGYANVPNCSFEEGLKEWDVSRAPGAEAKELPMLHPLVGQKVCLLPQGQEVFRHKADAQGRAAARVLQYRAKGAGQVVEAGRRVVKIEKTAAGPYTVRANGKQRSVALTADAEVAL